MQRIVFSGKEYLRASEIAKKFRYTQDYVGQLCRSKKVDARRVGRVWYVDPFSVSAYRQTKHQALKEGAVAVKAKPATPRKKESTMRRKSSKSVEPMLRSKTARLSRQGRTVRSSDSVGATYASDEGVLVPILKSKVEHPDVTKDLGKKTVVVERTPAVTVPVSSANKQTKFKSEKLPEISLSGKLSVEESREVPPPEEDLVPETPVGETAVTETEDVVVEEEVLSSEIEESADISEAIEETDLPAEYEHDPDLDLVVPEKLADEFYEESDSGDLYIVSPDEAKANKKGLSLWQALSLVLVSMIVGLFLLMLETEVTITGEGHTNSVRLDPQKFFEQLIGD